MRNSITQNIHSLHKINDNNNNNNKVQWKSDNGANKITCSFFWENGL